jgi:TonB family protein
MQIRLLFIINLLKIHKTIGIFTLVIITCRTTLEVSMKPMSSSLAVRLAQSSVAGLNIRPSRFLVEAVLILVVALAIPQRSIAQEQSKTNDAVAAIIVEKSVETTAAPTTIRSAEIVENTQSSYVQARINNKSELRRHLEYPKEALKAHKEGQVAVIVYLNAEGEIMTMNYESNAQANDPDNVFAAAAFEAVKKCSFTPALRNNKPVNSIVKIQVSFVI